jgi:hypothetical protein
LVGGFLCVNTDKKNKTRLWRCRQTYRIGGRGRDGKSIYRNGTKSSAAGINK